MNFCGDSHAAMSVAEVKREGHLLVFSVISYLLMSSTSSFSTTGRTESLILLP